MLTHEQLMGWMRYYTQQPFGRYVEALESAMTRQTVAAAFGGAKDSPLRDFMLAPPPDESSALPVAADPEVTMRLLAKKLGAVEAPALEATSAGGGE